MLTMLMKSKYNYPVNIGTDKEMTINESVKLINDIWNKIKNKIVQLIKLNFISV